MKRATKINISSLIAFSMGTGTKLLQSYLDGNNDIKTIPGYPLKYFYQFYDYYKKKYNNQNLIISKLLDAMPSIYDPSIIKSGDGLYNMIKKNNHKKMNRFKFENQIQNSFKHIKFNRKNLMIAIHKSYFQNIYKNKNFNFLIHIHDPKYHFQYLKNDFKKVRLILCCRYPIDHFWKRLNVDKKIICKKFDSSDAIILGSNLYTTRLIYLYNDLKFLKTCNNCLFIKFEDLKQKTKKTINKVFSFLNIKPNMKNYKSTFYDSKWTIDQKIYGYPNKRKIIYENDFKKFFSYEIFVIEYTMKSFLINKLNYISYNKFNFFDPLKYLFFLLLPTKFGLTNLYNHFKISNLFVYIEFCYREIYKLQKKNYYKNATFRYKREFKNYFFLINFFGREHLNKKSYIMKQIFFLFKILIYLMMPFYFFTLYLDRIYKNIKAKLVLSQIS